MKSKYILLWLLSVATNVVSQSSLFQQFQNPPNAAKPRVWWHWMNGNVTKEGIQKDLDWMQRTGIGGFQNFDANLFTPVVVPTKLVFMTPEWKEAFKFTTLLADKKGLEMAIAGSPGWSVTGGPWVEPKDGMKKFVWTETTVSGGMPIELKLPAPSGVTGKYQNHMLKSESFLSGPAGTPPVFYQDAMVIAYRIPSVEKSLREFNPLISSSGGQFSIQDLTDGDLMKTSHIPPMQVGEDMWLQYQFAEPMTFKAIALAGANHTGLEDFDGVPLNRTLKVSDDGILFKDVASLSGSTVPLNKIGFAPTTAKFWRIAFKTLPPPFNIIAAMSGGNPQGDKPDGVDIAEFNLYNTTRIDQIEDKTGFTPWKEDLKTYTDPNPDKIDLKDIVDLTTKMSPDGILSWNAPDGNWNIIRFGYSLTGRQNHPASPEATGLEVDKLDKAAVKKYINTYLDKYKEATGGMMGTRGLKYMVLDSYEAGHMNWTKEFKTEFKSRRGYDINSWIPALIGRTVSNTEASEKFLWDFRKTIGELIAENHYDVIGDELHKRGMKRYTESHEDRRIYLADGMDVKKNADIPMSAMWTPGSLAAGNNEEVRSEGDIRESASVANIYGKPFVAGESMTSVGRPFQEYPERLKRTADLEMASGLNRFVIHTSVHQPLETKPGFSLGPFGQYFTRHETWAEGGAKAWMAYLGRSSYLLQQGKNIADILYLYGENTNITWLCRQKLPDIRAGYEFDFVNSSALINAIKVEDGKLVSLAGNSYQVLMLDKSTRLMTLPVLKKIKTLVDAGVKLIGEKPEKSPSLSDDDAAFQSLASEVWKNKNILNSTTEINFQPDVWITNTNHKIVFRHRRTKLANNSPSFMDIYWLNNRSIDPTTAEISFRVAGKIPELWHPVTGKKEPLSYEIKNGRTIIPLHFESWDAYFIVFKEKALADKIVLPSKIETSIHTINTPWKLNIAGKTINITSLATWTENADADIKYFSGTAVYENEFTLNKKDLAAKYRIDLGKVAHISEVILNGKTVGTVWKSPFKIDITPYIITGNNSVKIKVTNTWVNRLIGDAQPGATKTTFTSMPFYKADGVPMPSGLLSNVNIIIVK